MILLRSLLLASLPMAAQAAPAFLPTHDVTVVYSVATPNQPPVRAAFSYQADSGQARLDSPYGSYVLANVQEGQATLVVPALHALVQAPDFSFFSAELRHVSAASFAPLGERHYAGLACENYALEDKDGKAQVCLTPDGITLHFTGQNGHGTASFTAESVSNAPVEDDIFAPPPGYTPVTLPPGAVAALLNPR